MLKFALFVAAVLIGAIPNAFAQSDMPEPNGAWVGYMDKNLGPMAVVNGEVTHRDFFRIIIRGENCDRAEHFVTFYTVAKHPDFLQISGKFLKVEINGEEVKAMAQYPRKFLAGQIAIIQLGVVSLDTMVEFLTQDDSIKMALLDRPEFKASDYFDIRENSWSSRSLREAVAEARRLCLANTGIRRG